MLEKEKNVYGAKMIENDIKDFSLSELQRVFKNCVSPIICVRKALKWIKEDNLTIKKLYQEYGG